MPSMMTALDVPEGGELDVGRAVEGGLDGRVVRDAHGAAGAAVEGLPEGQDLGPSGGEGGQLEGVLIGFSAAVTKEEGVVRVAAGFAQKGRQLALEAVFYGIGVKAQAGGLIRERLHITGMAVPHADDGVAAIKVRILLPVGGPEGGPQTLDRLYVPLLINVEELHTRKPML